MIVTSESFSPRRGPLFAATLLAALVVCASSTLADPASPPMTEEDVVRRVMSGTESTVLIDEIERREVQFDISDEMQTELATAGVSRTVIDAMVRRQRQLDAERAPPATADPLAEPALPLLRVGLGETNGDAPTLTIARQLSPQLESLLQLSPTDEPRMIEDVAVYLACLRGDHVPDHWRSHSPLGRDFLSMPRHRMLAFIAGATHRERRMTLALPLRLEAELGEAGTHQLSLGVALRVDDRYYRIGSDLLDGVDPDALDEPLEARVETARGGRIGTLDVRWLGEAVTD